MTLREVLRAAEDFAYIRIKVKKCGLMFETCYAAEGLKGHQNEEFEKLKEREVIRFCNNRVGIGGKTNELEIEIRRENDHIQDWQHNGSHSWKCEPEESGRSNGKIFESRKKEAKR